MSKKVYEAGNINYIRQILTNNSEVINGLCDLSKLQNNDDLDFTCHLESLKKENETALKQCLKILEGGYYV